MNYPKDKFYFEGQGEKFEKKVRKLPIKGIHTLGERTEKGFQLPIKTNGTHGIKMAKRSLALHKGTI